MLKKISCLLGLLVLTTGCDLIDSQMDTGQHSIVLCSGVAGPSIGDRVFFDLNKFLLTQEAEKTLDRQTAWLKKYDKVKVTIEGHTDERGTREYDLALGERRAEAVKNYLVSLGVNEHRIKTISYGKEKPAVPGHDEKAWGQNRRAVTVVTPSSPDQGNVH